MKIKEMIVVEGKADTVKIHQAVNADTIETNGSAISKETLRQIQHAQEKRGVIVFTDPDYPGERIRNKIADVIPGCKHAFLTDDQARAKSSAQQSLGVEHASVSSIQSALKAVYELTTEALNEFSKQDLMDYGLIGSPKASERRQCLGELLRLGHTNGKQLLKRLNMFQVTRSQLEETLTKIQLEEENGH